MKHCCYHFVVSGRVQGVFYRASAQQKARQLGLNGWVRNLRTGQVELVACGDRKNIDKLEQWLWLGPKFSEVNEVKSENLSATAIDVHEGFEVRRDV
ncbi:MAG: acylphosphatase [Arenicellales bacterium]|jgi:acylphosphatase